MNPGDSLKPNRPGKKSGRRCRERGVAVKTDKKKKKTGFGQVFKNDIFQRLLIGIVSLLAVFAMISSGAAPKRYKLTLGMRSEFDIRAPRDIENTMKTEELALEKVKEIPPVIRELENANTKMLGEIYDFFDDLENIRTDLIPELSKNQEKDPAELIDKDSYGKSASILLDIPREVLTYLFKQETGPEIRELKELFVREFMQQISAANVTAENLSQTLATYNLKIDQRISSIQIQQLGKRILSEILVPNSIIDEAATENQKNAFIEAYKSENPVMIYRNEIILRKGEIVTADKIDVLRRLGSVDEKNRPDYLFLASVLLLLFMLWFVLALFMKFFSKKHFASRNDLLLIATIIVLTVFLAWMAKEIIPEYAPYFTIGFIAPVLLAIFLNIQLAVVVNIVITFAASLMFPENAAFIIMLFISGTVAAFLSANASQRRKISLAGLIIGAINIVVVACVGVIEKKEWTTFLYEGGIAFLNGILSVILAIGLLPFLESIFNVITPLKLLELADPNHPLLKRLLMEAPGTYHHSLMVGNLSEVAVRQIGGNALLARVGAYFHDIGKLMRPGFFKENQMSENPHDRITPNLSTLVITSHTKDGDELAKKHKLPKAIRDIILQHHGSTLVAYFYHKAKQGEKGVEVKEGNFRYEGPIPQSREAAVVLLADSVEAAVRSMPDKTKGKIEGLIRKIIKDKLDDGQLDNCDLTLKDMNDIANAFLTVLSGVFHERNEYPELEKKDSLSELDNQVYNIIQQDKREKKNEGNNSKQTEKEIPSTEESKNSADESRGDRIQD
ncbi:MAG: HDIG domain-containing protein [Clostridiaceae bacterium]|nr:HDIG domain-containing protein [Clostridiaceae bacterium]